MRIKILSALLISLSFLTSCTTGTAYNSNYKTAYIYTDDDDLYSNRVDYLGYGLGGQGLGGDGMGGYGLTGYG
ncbi:hypothetical protein, partial [uncultured Legionella sp.]|uniref:hypothetical protein n=1 Tax=uncultured Legionella sp. TaxID=210934 RepID=UPI0026275698